MSEDSPPASTGKASAVAAAAAKSKAPAAPPVALRSRGSSRTGSAAAFMGLGSTPAPPSAMGSRGPSGAGLAAAFMGRRSSSPAAPNSSYSAATFFPGGSSHGGWGYPRSSGSSHGGGPFTSSASSCGFPFPPSQRPVWCEAPAIGSPSNWDPTRDKETYPPGGFMTYFGKSKESAIDVEGLDKLSKIQESVAENRMKALEIQQKLSAEKLESSRMAHLTAQENKEAKKLEKEAKMMEAYTTIMSRDTSSMSDEGKSEHIARGFPGMLGSIDCMHWEWKNCPKGWAGMFTRGDKGVPTMILEAVASHDLHIWHAFFGTAGSQNDLNVLNKSPLFIDAIKGEAPTVHYNVNGNQYDMGYYLGDKIYPEWAVFVKTISSPQSDKDKLFASMQEGARKDVECAFGVLQSRFGIVRRPARLWKQMDVINIMQACVILHNMIVEDEKELVRVALDINENASATIVLPSEVRTSNDPNPCFAEVLRRNSAIQARPTHRQLKKDLVEHIWQRYGNRGN